jgi:secretion/DNA translocation related TadE-like protein
VVLAIGLVGLLTVIALICGAVVALVGVHRRIQAAADLAALAGAASAQQGGPACVAARRIAGRNGATSSTCRLDGAIVTVTATLVVPGLVHRSLTAQARAGPVKQ